MEHRPGKHLILDIFNAKRLSEVNFIEEVITKAATICQAKILNLNLHHFGGEGGVTGVALLAESHISIHTWPELSYVAVDIFLCGNCYFEGVIEYFKVSFQSNEIQVNLLERGHAPQELDKVACDLKC